MDSPMKYPKFPDDIDTQSLDLTWPVVFSVAGLTLLRSKSVVCQTLGASLMTLSLIRLIKNSPLLPEKAPIWQHGLCASSWITRTIAFRRSPES